MCGYTVKPYPRKHRPPQLGLGTDGSLNPELSCQYCKDTGHLKENCIKLDRRLAQENRQPEKSNSNQLPKSLKNWDLLWSQTKPKERRRVVLILMMRIKIWFFSWIMPPFWQRQKLRSCNAQLLNAPRCALVPMEFKFHLYWILPVKWHCFSSHTLTNTSCQKLNQQQVRRPMLTTCLN